MSLTDELVLPEDVRVIPVAQLTAAVRDEIGSADGFAITRPLGRSTSSVVGPEVAELLGEFRSPSTVAAAVIRYSRRNRLDPEQTLDEAYPALRQCVGEGYLVPSGSAASQRVEASLRPGDEFGGTTVVRLLHLLDDTELHQVRSADGSLGAAKIARGVGGDVPIKVRETFAREAAALRLLAGTSAPELRHDGSDEDRPWLLLEWCEGAVATAAARADRVALFLDDPRGLRRTARPRGAARRRASGQRAGRCGRPGADRRLRVGCRCRARRALPPAAGCRRSSSPSSPSRCWPTARRLR